MQIQAIGSGAGLDQAMSLAVSGSGSSSQKTAASGASSPGTSVQIQAASSTTTATGTSSTASSDAYYDIMDTNKDGYVSALERLIYYLTHPGAASETQAAKATANDSGGQGTAISAYNRQGGVSGGTAQSLIDLIA